jgi:hypothetical protein
VSGSQRYHAQFAEPFVGLVLPRYALVASGLEHGGPPCDSPTSTTTMMFQVAMPRRQRK